MSTGCRTARRHWRVCATVAALAVFSGVRAGTYIPSSDSQVLVELPPGARHVDAATRDQTLSRIDLAVPIAQFYISRARATGDLRFLGYAESVLSPWFKKPEVPSEIRVLYATVLQSRHSFVAALSQLDLALHSNPNNTQAWLTRATVLRVLGRYDEALASCQHLANSADPSIATLCEQSIYSLTGHLRSAYAAVVSLSPQTLAPEARVWRYSELGEMAERLGNDSSAEHWFRNGLEVAPDDFYIRAAYADLLLRQHRAQETLALLQGYESMEPMLLRIAIAKLLLEPGFQTTARDLLAAAFAAEEQRGDGVHRREQARFFLDVDPEPENALAAARQNWQIQREPDDALILLRAALAAHRREDALPAREFLARQNLEDARLTAVLEATP